MIRKWIPIFIVLAFILAGGSYFAVHQGLTYSNNATLAKGTAQKKADHADSNVIALCNQRLYDSEDSSLKKGTEKEPLNKTNRSFGMIPASITWNNMTYNVQRNCHIAVPDQYLGISSSPSATGQFKYKTFRVKDVDPSQAIAIDDYGVYFVAIRET